GAVQVTNMGRVFLGVVVLSAIISITIPGNLAAQGRGGMPGHAGASMAGAPHGAAVPSGMAGARVGAVGAGSLGHVMISRSASGHVTLRHGLATSGVRSYHTRVGTAVRGGQLSATRRRVFSRDSEAVPGLGFDYSHVAATRPGGVNGRHHHGNNRNDGAVLFPFFGGGGYFVPTGSDVMADYGAEGQPVEEADDEEGAAPAERPARVYNVDRLPALGPPAPQRDVPEYIFVRRDGTVFFAVAYTWESGSLRYVSSEGLSRSVSRETLDLNATQQFNEQRGMAFRSPA
ncbi:MAG: hypothetical protein ABLT11_01835, partial [Candidatus Acidiferrum sp.]